MNYDINDYVEQLKEVCGICKKSNRCKDKGQLCLLKRQVWTLAKWRMKRREKVGVK